jgi:hypothetical protein
MPRDPEELREEAKDVIDEISDLDKPVPVFDELMEYLKTVRDICEALGNEPEASATNTPASPGTSS